MAQCFDNEYALFCLSISRFTYCAALHAYLDRLHAENPSSRVYKPEDNIAEAIAEYLKSKKHKEI